MRASEPEVVDRMRALYGGDMPITKRPIGPVLMVMKYLDDRDTLSTLTSRALVKMK